jgi:hypothetical protein
MLGLYTPLLALQAFCVYHAYRNNADYKWYWLIIIFPLVGCLIYLYHNFYNRNTVQTITQGVKEVVNSNYRVEQLEKAVRFNDNLSNQVNLADAYVTLARYEEAIKLYSECLAGFMAEDPDLRMKVLHASFMNKDYATSVLYGEMLANEKSFKNSEARVAYAWTLHLSGKKEEAQLVFQDMNKSFTNYAHRLEYGRFLKETNQLESLKELIAELDEEFNHMKGQERRTHRHVIQQIRDLTQNQ